jgi:putative isomerase
MDRREFLRTTGLALGTARLLEAAQIPTTRDLGRNRKMEELYEQCLRRNWVEGGEYSNLPYAWIASGEGFHHYLAACDAALCGILTAMENPERAREMFRNHWHWMEHNSDFPKGSAGYGMIPGIVRVDHGAYYRNFKLSQTPLTAWGVWEVYEQDRRKEFLRESLPHLLTNHEWFERERDIDNDLLVEVGSYTQWAQALRYESVEAALDPTEEEIANEISSYYVGGRPGLKTNFVGRMTNRKKEPTGERYYSDLESVEMTAGMVLAEKSIARIASELGESGLASQYLGLARRREQAMNRWMWDAKDGFYYDINRDTHEVFRLKTAMGFLPMVSGSCSGEQAQALVQNLLNPSQFWTRFPVSTYSRPALEDAKRGRVESSVLVNFLLNADLSQYGFQEEAKTLTEVTLERVQGPVWAGRWNSDTGEPVGPARAASAALVILMIEQNYGGMKERFRAPAPEGEHA